MSRIGMNGIMRPPLAACVVRHGTQSVSAANPIIWYGPIVNRYGMWDPTNPGRINIPVSGLYKFGVAIRYNNPYSDWNEVYIVRNQPTSTNSSLALLRTCHGTGPHSVINGMGVARLDAGDFLIVTADRTQSLMDDHGRFWIYEVQGNVPLVNAASQR